MSMRDVLSASLIEKIEAKGARIGVIGLGFIGTTIMHSFIRAGFAINGYDHNISAVSTCRAVTGDTFGLEKWSVSTDSTILRGADVFVVAVRVLSEPDSPPDLTPLENVARLLSGFDLKGRLILLESTLPGGSTLRFAREWLNLDEMAPTFVAHCPERLSVGDGWRELRTIPHLVGGIDLLATSIAAKLMSTIVDQVVSVSSPEVSELAKLLENAFVATNISLVSEITRLAHCLGVTGTEVCEAAGTKPSGYMPFYPGPGIGGHCLPNDLAILRHTFELHGENSSVLDAVSKEADAMPDRVFHRLVELFPGKLEGTEVLIVGVGFKPNSPETIETPTRPLVRLLRKAGAHPVYIDSNVSVFEVDNKGVEKVEFSTLRPGRYKIAVVVAGDNQVDSKGLAQVAELVFDASGGRAAGVDGIACLRL